MHWLRLLPVAFSLSIASQGPLSDDFEKDECGLPTGEDAPVCFQAGRITYLPKIRSLSCNFTLSTTVKDVTLQYGLTRVVNREEGGLVVQSGYEAPATFFSLSDSTVNAYSPMIPGLNDGPGDITDGLFKFWFAALFSTSPSPRHRVYLLPFPQPRKPTMNFWPYQNLAYFCATKNESIPPILTLPLPDPSGYILSTDVDAFVNGSGSAKVLEMVEWRHFAEYPELEEIQLVAQIIPPSQSADSAGSGEL